MRIFPKSETEVIKERVIGSTLSRGTIAEQVELLKVLEQPQPTRNVIDSLSRIAKKLLIIFLLIDVIFISFDGCNPPYTKNLINDSGICQINRNLFGFFFNTQPND